MARKQPKAFEVMAASFGPYTKGEKFAAGQLTDDEANTLVDNGTLRGLDEFGDPVKPDKVKPMPEPEPVASADEAPVSKADEPAPKAKK